MDITSFSGGQSKRKRFICFVIDVQYEDWFEIVLLSKDGVITVLVTFTSFCPNLFCRLGVTDAFDFTTALSFEVTGARLVAHSPLMQFGIRVGLRVCFTGPPSARRSTNSIHVIEPVDEPAPESCGRV